MFNEIFFFLSLTTGGAPRRKTKVALLSTLPDRPGGAPSMRAGGLAEASVFSRTSVTTMHFYCLQGIVEGTIGSLGLESSEIQVVLTSMSNILHL